MGSLNRSVGTRVLAAFLLVAMVMVGFGAFSISRGGRSSGRPT